MKSSARLYENLRKFRNFRPKYPKNDMLKRSSDMSCQGTKLDRTICVFGYMQSPNIYLES